jgi:hypothetical protein
MAMTGIRLFCTDTKKWMEGQTMKFGGWLNPQVPRDQGDQIGLIFAYRVITC